MSQIQHAAFWIFIPAMGLSLFYTLISWRHFARYLNPRPMTPIFALTSANGQQVDLLDTQAALPALIEHDPEQRPKKQRKPMSRWEKFIVSAALVFIIFGALFFTVGPGHATNQATLAATPLTALDSGYLYVSSGTRIIYLDNLQGALSSTTSNWDEVDVRNGKLVYNHYPITYSCSSWVVTIRLATADGTITLSGSTDNTYTHIRLRLPQDPKTHLFPNAITLASASQQEYNTALSTLKAEYGG